MSANTSAFPQHGFTSVPEVAARMADKGGMTMRQYYKAAALQRIAHSEVSQHGATCIANDCAAIADALLAEDENYMKHIQASEQQAHHRHLNATSAAGGPER